MMPVGTLTFIPFQTISIANGDSNQWDITTLTSLLLNGDRPKTLSQAQIQELDHEDLLLKQLRDIRNKLAHHASKAIDDTEFSQLWTDITNILVAFGESDCELDKLKDDSVFEAPIQSINKENAKEATRLNTLGTQAHKDGKFSDVIALFTKATVLLGVLDRDRAVFYSNISSSRLALYEKQQNGTSSIFEIDDQRDQRYLALQDAKLACNLWPTWWKGHFRVGKVYATLNEHDKAVNSFERALALEPTKEEIRKALDESRHILSRPRTVPEQLNALQETIGINPENLRMLHSLAEATDSAVADILKGYKYEHGDVDVKQDYEQAAKYYAKAAG
ncbi:unnamed protein product [Rotaria sordida]|uniref:DZIP3-like HEPN domain-containing protein n=1 Tax=Rotaria sordida TaxID=392033 RepID=A0A819X6H0_9BILA|nr:unnamed protein product [Rotaria sordida]